MIIFRSWRRKKHYQSVSWEMKHTQCMWLITELLNKTFPARHSAPTNKNVWCELNLILFIKSFPLMEIQKQNKTIPQHKITCLLLRQIFQKIKNVNILVPLAGWYASLLYQPFSYHIKWGKTNGTPFFLSFLFFFEASRVEFVCWSSNYYGGNALNLFFYS